MGWSIKKPFGSKKSILNQIVNVHKAAAVAVVAAPVAVVKPQVYQDILVKNDLMGKEEAALAAVGAKVGTSIVGGALIAGAMASNETAAAIKAAADKAEKAKKDAEEALKIKEATELANKIRQEAEDIAHNKAVKEAADKAAAELAKRALPPPNNPLPPAAPAVVVNTLFKDPASVVPTAPVLESQAAGGAPREMDFLEMFFAWLAGKF